jgi:ankyrin repeat protein
MENLLIEEVKKNNLDNIKLLLNAGAIVNFKDKYGRMAYDYAKTDEIKNLLNAHEKKIINNYELSNY